MLGFKLKKWRLVKRIFDCTAVLAALFLFGPSYAAGGPAGQAYLAWSGALLVRSGGRRQRDLY